MNAGTGNKHCFLRLKMRGSTRTNILVILGIFFASLTEDAAAVSGQLTVAEIKALPNYEAAGPNDPVLKPKHAVIADRTESRLRESLPALIGVVARVERNPSYSGDDTLFPGDEQRSLRLGFWKIEGEFGHAFILLDVLGGLRIQVERNAAQPSKPTLAEAQEILKLLWGGVPSNQPTNGGNTAWEWHGPDGIGDHQRTRVSVRFRRRHSLATAGQARKSTEQISITTGTPFEEWQTLAVDKLGQGARWLSKRQAMANAVHHVSVASDQAVDPGAVFRSIRHSNFGWSFEFIVSSNVAEPYLRMSLSDSAGGHSSNRSAHASILSPDPEGIAIGPVRGWPEYHRAVARHKRKAAAFKEASRRIKPKMATAIAFHRPHLASLTQQLKFSADAWCPQRGVANYVRETKERVPLFTLSFQDDGSEARLLGGVMIVPADDRDPPLADRSRWIEIAQQGFSEVFGVRETSEPASVLYSQKDPPVDIPNSEFAVETLSIKWVEQVAGKWPLVDRTFIVERQARGHVRFYWSCPLLPERQRNQIQRIAANAHVSEDTAAVIATKAAALSCPDLLKDDWSLSATSPILDHFGPEGPPMPRDVHGEPRLVWNITFRKFSRGRRYVVVDVDGVTGEALLVQTKTTLLE